MGFHLTWDFTYEISFVKGFVLFHIDLSISFALFSWEFGDVFKTIILFLFSCETFFEEDCRHHAGEGMFCIFVLESNNKPDSGNVFWGKF